MSAILDLSGLTLNEEEARDVSEIIQDQVYVRPELTEVHEVMTGVTMDKYIPILGQLDLVGKLDPGSCSTNTESSQVPASEKMWSPKLISFRMQHCQDDLPALLKFWEKSRRAAGTWEDVSDQMMAFIVDRVTEATINSIIRIAEFGDTDHSAVGAGTGDEVLTSGTDKTYFNMLDGMWNQIFTDQALATPLSHRYPISENAEASKSAQLALASDRALNMFRDLYNNIDPRAFEGNQLKFQVTRSIFNNWQDMMEDKSLVFMLDRTEKGSTKFSYRGIPIVPRYDWTRLITSYFDNGTTYNLPHRAVLTDLANIPIGTSDTESLSELLSWYEKKDKAWYFDVAYKIDQKNLQEYRLAVAY